MFPNIFVHIYFRSASNMQLDIREIRVTLGNHCDNTDFDKPMLSRVSGSPKYSHFSEVRFL